MGSSWIPGLYGLAHHEQAPLAAVIPPALGYVFLVGYAGWQAGKWVFRQFRRTGRKAH